MSGFSVALKLHTGVISTQYVGPLKAARSRKPLGYLVPSGDGYPHCCTVSYAAPAPTVFAAPGLVVEHISPALAVCPAPASVVEYILQRQRQATPRQRQPCSPRQLLSWNTLLRLLQCVRHQLQIVECIAPVAKLRRASVYSVCHTRSRRGFHVSSSSSVCCTSSCRGEHRSSASGKPCRVLSWTTFLQILRCMPHQLLWWSTSLQRRSCNTFSSSYRVCRTRRVHCVAQHWRELQRIRRCTRGSLHSRSR